MRSGLTRRDAMLAAGGVVAGTTLFGTGAATAQSTTSWTQFQHDAGNSGAVPGASGPAAGVTERWTYSTFARVNTDNAPVVADGTVYLAGRDFYLHAVDAETGTERWSVDTGAEMRSTPVAVDGSVYVPVDGGELHAYDAATGDRRWRYDYPGDENPNMLLTYADGTLYLPKVAAIDAADGTERWRVEVGSNRGVAVAGGTVYTVEGDTDRVHALDAATGERVWRKRVGARLSYHVAPTVAGGLVYVLTSAGTVLALDAGNGAIQWRYDLGEGRPRGSPAVAGNTLVVGQAPTGDDGGPSNAEGAIHAVDTRTGENRWTVSTAGAVVDSPSILDGVAYVGSHGNGEGTMYAIAVDDGTVRWRESVRDDVKNHAVVDGSLYVVTEDGYVSAYAERSTTTTTTPGDGESPRAAFEYAPERPTVGEEVTFDASYAADPDGEVVEYQWQFSHGGAQTSASGRRVRHRFDTDGEATVRLRVTDDDGNEGRTERTVTVRQSAGGGGGSSGGGSGGGGSSGGGGGDEGDGDAGDRQRGFLTNGGDEPSVLADALNLTMLGFLLSVGGIVHQMIKGR